MDQLSDRQLLRDFAERGLEAAFGELVRRHVDLVNTMTDGRLCIVESDDYFQSWEAQHIIPPPFAGQ